MFSFNIDGVPSLEMIPIETIDRNKFYLTADQKCVVTREPRDDSYIVFDLKEGDITVFCAGDLGDLIDNYSWAALVFPDGVVSISLNLAIKGGGDAN